MLYHIPEFHSFLRLNNTPLYVYTTFCYPSSVDLCYPYQWTFGYFYLLAVVSSVFKNSDVQISV